MRKQEDIENEILKYETIRDGYKIVLNGSFGKLGSKYSKLYSPDLMLAVTITGQLTLLMIIEQLEALDIPVMSANTDGLEYFCPRGKMEKKALKLMSKLEKASGYVLEHGDYDGLYARDVNNYVADYGKYTKAKGVYCDPMLPENFLKKNPQTPICFEAVRKFLLDGTPMKKTIRECKDVTKFLSSRSVTGGGTYGTPIYGPSEQAVDKEGEPAFNPTGKPKMMTPVIGWEKGAEYLGKTVRWYYIKNGTPIHYMTNGNKVPLSDSCKPMMNLTKKIPKDLDYQWYYNYAERMLKDLGYEKD